MNRKLLLSLFVSSSIMFGSIIPVLGAPAPEVTTTDSQDSTIYKVPGNPSEFVLNELYSQGYPRENVQYNCSSIIKEHSTTIYRLDVILKGGKVIKGCITLISYDRGPVIIRGMSAQEVIGLISMS